MAEPELPEVTADEFFAVLGSLLEQRKAGLKKTSVSFSIVEDGPFYLDTRQRPLVGPGLLTEADATVVSNRRTLADILFGNFDADEPQPGQMFLWEGDPKAFENLASVLEAGKSLFAAHMSSLKGS